MLVLSRHRHERIIIDHDIIIEVLEIRGDKVRLGIIADESVPIHREEVYVEAYPDRTLPPSPIQ